MEVLHKAAASMAAIAASLPGGSSSSTTSSSSSDSFAFRGKVRSLRDAAATAVQHAALLLSEATAVLAARDEAGGEELRDRAARLRQVQGGSSAGACLACRALGMHCC